MVSIRCKMVVKDELIRLRMPYRSIDLGQVDLEQDITPRQREELATSLLRYGLELLEDKQAILIEKIKNVIIELIHYTDETPLVKFSEYLHKKLGYDYTYMANLFSETEGITIEHFMIRHKIERAKELILYNELTISEIAWKLHYSSAAHLSYQFKKITGLTPSYFRSLKLKRRTDLDHM